MRTCAECHREFPTKVVIEGRSRNLQRRKRCLDCSPFGSHNTRKVGQVALGGTLLRCRDCGREYLYDRQKGHNKTRCNTCRTMERKRRLKKKLVALKGGCCQSPDCDYSRAVEGLDFHHIDASAKLFTIAANTNRSWSSLVAEVAKCHLVCATCHREIHAGVRDSLTLTLTLIPGS